MPFIQRPEGFSAATLELLDSAIMQIYLDHVAAAETELKAASARGFALDDTAPPPSLLVHRARVRREKNTG